MNPLNKALWLVFLLLLALLCWYWGSSSTEPAQAAVRQQVAAPKPAPAQPETSPSQPLSSETTSNLIYKAKKNIHLRVGETAVLSYHEIEPGAQGLLFITPTPVGEGQVKMEAKVVRFSGEHPPKEDFKHLLPQAWEWENFGALDESGRQAALRAMSQTKGVDMLSAPTVVTRPGNAATIVVGGRNGASTALALNAKNHAEGGYDLSLGYEKKGALED